MAFTYEADTIRVDNTSQEEIAISGFSFGSPRNERAEPRLVAPGFYYFFRIDGPTKQRLSDEAQGKGGTLIVPCWAFISVQRADTKVNYTASCLMHVVAGRLNFTIDMQNLGMKTGWVTQP